MSDSSSITLPDVEVTATRLPPTPSPSPAATSQNTGGTDELSIRTGDRIIYGWTGIELQTGIEVFPSHFQISMTEKFPDSAIDLVVHPGDPIQVYFGDTLMLTGYIDRYSATIDAHSHDVTIVGRSKCEDLIDCSAFFGDTGEGIVAGQSSSIKGVTTLNGNVTMTSLAQALCQPFSLTVTNKAGDDGLPVPSFVINLGESPFDILTRVGRYSGYLVMDDPTGNLVLDRAGSTSMASNLVQGTGHPGGVQAASVSYTIDQRFSDYYVIAQSVNDQQNIGSQIQVAHAQDPGPIRFRPTYHVSSLFAASNQGNGAALAQQEAQWEANRNYGRSMAITVITDSWRDSAGTPWQRNAMITVSMPSVKCANQTWIIAQVTFRRDLNGGTSAELVIMPKVAFLLEPILLNQPVPANLKPGPDPPAPGSPGTTTGLPGKVQFTNF